ncbi:MAG: hypothetical protein M3Z25_15250 [Actinomycetota bacterium]|nr:hypothetical protein [Actinomycetota bacterium]
MTAQAVDLKQAPDPTSFLSTATVLVGILVTIIGAAILQVVLESKQDSSLPDLQLRRLRFIGLVVALAVNIWGVGFPFWALYKTTIGTVSESLVTAVMWSTAAVVIANLVVPLYIIDVYKTYSHWLYSVRLMRNAGNEQDGAVRELLVEGGYITEYKFEKMTKKSTSRLSDQLATELLVAMSRAFFVGTPEGVRPRSINGLVLHFATIPIIRWLVKHGSIGYEKTYKTETGATVSGIFLSSLPSDMLPLQQPSPTAEFVRKKPTAEDTEPSAG